MNFSFKNLKSLIRKSEKENKNCKCNGINTIKRIDTMLMRLNNLLARISVHSINPYTAAYTMKEDSRWDVYHMCNECHHILTYIITALLKIKNVPSNRDIIEEIGVMVVKCIEKLNEMIKYKECLIDKNGMQIRSDCLLEKNKNSYHFTSFYSTVKDNLCIADDDTEDEEQSISIEELSDSDIIEMLESREREETTLVKIPNKDNSEESKKQEEKEEEKEEEYSFEEEEKPKSEPKTRIAPNKVKKSAFVVSRDKTKPKCAPIKCKSTKNPVEELSEIRSVPECTTPSDQADDEMEETD